jgi:outer membrane receptor protein involved in Fe transport
VFSQNPSSRTGSGNAFADFLLGLPDSSSIGTNVRAGIRVRNYSSFIQDDWKGSNRLTMNIGVRYEYTTPVIEVADRMANFDMATNKGCVGGAGFT